MSNQGPPLQNSTNFQVQYDEGEYSSFLDEFPFYQDYMNNQDDGANYPSGAQTGSSLAAVPTEPRVPAYFNPSNQQANFNAVPNGVDYNNFFYNRFPINNHQLPVHRTPNPVYRNSPVLAQQQGHSNEFNGVDSGSVANNQSEIAESVHRSAPNILPTLHPGHRNPVYSKSHSQTVIGPIAQNYPPNYHSSQRSHAGTPTIPLPPPSNHNIRPLHAPQSNSTTIPVPPPSQSVRNQGTLQDHNFTSRLPLNRPAASNSLNHFDPTVTTAQISPIGNSSTSPHPTVTAAQISPIDNSSTSPHPTVSMPKNTDSKQNSGTQAGKSATIRHRNVQVQQKQKTSKKISKVADADSGDKSTGSSDSERSDDSSDSSEEEPGEETGNTNGEPGEETGNTNEEPVEDESEEDEPTPIDFNRIDSDDEVDFRDRDRRQNVFLRPTKKVATIFKQRNSINNQKYFRILEKQGKLADEEIRVMYTDYPTTTTYSSLEKADKEAWAGLATAVAVGHKNFSFIAAAKRPNLVKTALARIHADSFQAFGFPVLSVVFPPGDIKGDALYVVTNYRDGPLHPYHWLRRKNPKGLKTFSRDCLDYADAIWNPTDESRKEMEVARKKTEKRQKREESDPVLRRLLKGRRDGVRIWKDVILSINVESARKVFHAGIVDRYKRNGWPVGDGEVIYWNNFTGSYRELFLNPDMLPKVTTKEGNREAGLAAYSLLHKADMDAWLVYFLAHQNGDIDWEGGMLFRDVRPLNLDLSKTRVDIVDLFKKVEQNEVSFVPPISDFDLEDMKQSLILLGDNAYATNTLSIPDANIDKGLSPPRPVTPPPLDDSGDSDARLSPFRPVTPAPPAPASVTSPLANNDKDLRLPPIDPSALRATSSAGSSDSRYTTPSSTIEKSLNQNPVSINPPAEHHNPRTKSISQPHSSSPDPADPAAADPAPVNPTAANPAPVNPAESVPAQSVNEQRESGLSNVPPAGTTAHQSGKAATGATAGGSKRTLTAKGNKGKENVPQNSQPSPPTAEKRATRAATSAQSNKQKGTSAAIATTRTAKSNKQKKGTSTATTPAAKSNKQKDTSVATTTTAVKRKNTAGDGEGPNKRPRRGEKDSSKA